MTFRRFLDWLSFSETVIEDIYIYEQTDYFAYTEYTGTFDAILEKEVVTVDLRICHNRMIVTACIK